MNPNQHKFPDPEFLAKLASENKPKGRKAELVKWYDLSYKIFANAPLESIDDFWRIVAYTYSWMPKIPAVNPHLIKDDPFLLKKLKALRNGHDELLKELLDELIPVINNSLVGTSKALHFISPSHVPIIDSNVIKGWDTVFLMSGLENPVRFPGIQAERKSQIGAYLNYRSCLIQWATNWKVETSLREIERYLFEVGRSGGSIKTDPEMLA